MTTFEWIGDAVTRPRRLVIGGMGAIVILLLFLRSGPPPQMGVDEQVFDAVDALFTAVTARDERLLGRCQERLQRLRDDGKLPAEAFDHLDGIARSATAGGWQSAAERLYAFMAAQRREGSLAKARPRNKKASAIQ